MPLPPGELTLTLPPGWRSDLGLEGAVPLAGMLPEPDLLVGSSAELVSSFELVEPALVEGLLESVVPDQALVEVTALAGQAVVALVEEDGLFQWLRPERRTTEGLGEKLRFRIGGRRVPGDRDRKKRKVRLLRWVFDQVLGLAAPAVLRRLERDKGPRLLHVGDGGLSPLDPGGVAALGGPSRVLVLVHGCFSSSAQSYGALLEGAGREAFGRLRSRYDLVLAFDHRTLSEDPAQNATQLATALGALGWSASPRVDLLSYSRGALVARCLAELDLGQPRPTLGRVLMVGPACGGTVLASPERWDHLVGRWTTAASTLSFVGGLLPGAGQAVATVGKALGGVADFVGALAGTVLDPDMAPGLSAMDPAGAFLAALDASEAPLSPGLRYDRLVSDFEPRGEVLDGVGHEGLPSRLGLAVADLAADGVLGGPNDLVVDNASADRLPARLAGVLGEKVVLARNRSVHHLGFFGHPRGWGWVEG